MQYIYEDTGQPYSGQVVVISGEYYTTIHGTLEGTSRVVIPINSNGTRTAPMPNSMNQYGNGGSRNCGQAQDSRSCNSLGPCSWCAPERRCKPSGQCGVSSGRRRSPGRTSVGRGTRRGGGRRGGGRRGGGTGMGGGLIGEPCGPGTTSCPENYCPACVDELSYPQACYPCPGTGETGPGQHDIPSGGTHSHQYSQQTQQHWGANPGGTTNAPYGYTHTDNGGSSHSHAFSPGVQQHWGQHPGGQGHSTQGYSHTHTGTSTPGRGNGRRKSPGRTSAKRRSPGRTSAKRRSPGRTSASRRKSPGRTSAKRRSPGRSRERDVGGHEHGGGDHGHYRPYNTLNHNHWMPVPGNDMWGSGDAGAGLMHVHPESGGGETSTPDWRPYGSAQTGSPLNWNHLNSGYISDSDMGWINAPELATTDSATHGHTSGYHGHPISYIGDSPRRGGSGGHRRPGRRAKSRRKSPGRTRRTSRGASPRRMGRISGRKN